MIKENKVMGKNSLWIKKIIFTITIFTACFSFFSCAKTVVQSERMSCPVGVNLIGDRIIWEPVEGASSYKIYMNDELLEDNITNPYYLLSGITDAGIYKLNVVTNGTDGKIDSVKSIPVTYTYDRDGIFLSAGEMHSAYLDDEGKIWVWGDNTFNQVSSAEKMLYNAPTVITADTKFTAVSAGGYHTLALDENGNVWSWGDNSFGQLGRSSEENTFGMILSEIKFKAISAGGTHSLAIDTDGNIWAWGNAQNGRCGAGENTENISEPVQITENTSYQKISAGGMHSLALDENGAVWVWGNNVLGQLGDGTVEDAYTPKKMEFEGEVEVISAGLQESAIIDSSNKLWLFGEGVLYPQLLEESQDFYTVSLGNKFGLAIDCNRQLWGWGANDFGQLGSASEKEQTMEKSAFTQPVSVIECGGTHSLLITNNSDIMASGNNARGQTGNTVENKAEKFFEIKW